MQPLTDVLNSFYRITGEEDPSSRIWIPEVAPSASSDGDPAREGAPGVDAFNDATLKRISRLLPLPMVGRRLMQDPRRTPLFRHHLGASQSRTLPPVNTVYKRRTNP